MHFLEGKPNMFDNKEKGHYANEATKEQVENERIWDSKLLHVGLHLPQQLKVKLGNHEKPQSNHTKEIVLQVRLVPQEWMYRYSEVH